MRLFAYTFGNGSDRFNPRICKRCDAKWPHTIGKYAVSIHASVKDATKRISKSTLHIIVSIHASVKDATNLKVNTSGFNRFNPRICKRCDSFRNL